MSEVDSNMPIPENVLATPVAEEKMSPPWWEGKGKEWKLSVAGQLSGITSGEELLKQYPEMDRASLIRLKENLLRKGSLRECQTAVEVIIGALGSLTINDLNPSTYPEHLLDPHYKANSPSGTLRKSSQEVDF